MCAKDARLLQWRMEMEMHCKRGSRHICVQRQFDGEHGEVVELVGLFS